MRVYFERSSTQLCKVLSSASTVSKQKDAYNKRVKVARKRKSRTSLNFTFNLNTSYLASLFTWLKFTCVNVRIQKRVSGN